MGNLSSGKSALVHRYLTGTYVQEESPEGKVLGAWGVAWVLALLPSSKGDPHHCTLPAAAAGLCSLPWPSSGLSPPSAPSLDLLLLSLPKVADLRRRSSWTVRVTCC